MDHFTNKTPFFNLEHLKFMLFRAKGRLNRRRYWLIILFIMISYVAILSFLGLTSFNQGHPDYAKPLATWEVVFLIFWYLFATYVHIMAGIKRAHDRGRSGHFLWLFLIPIVSLWPFVELGFLKGTKGPNAFGEDPLR